MKTFHCYDIENSMVLIRHHWLDRQTALWKIAMKMRGLQQDFVTWKICQEASVDIRGQQITFKPNCFKNFWKHKDRFGFERTAETDTSIHKAKVVYIFHRSFLQLPTMLMVSILDWITVCVRVARLDFFRSKFAKSGSFQSRLDQKKIIWTFGPFELKVWTFLRF